MMKNFLYLKRKALGRKNNQIMKKVPVNPCNLWSSPKLERPNWLKSTFLYVEGHGAAKGAHSGKVRSPKDILGMQHI